MSEPVHIAAIDAGSNAVRLAVARAYSALDIEPLVNERYSLRLGEGVFLRHRFSEDLFKKGVKAFQHFHEIMDEFGVTRYRAVATSASREARNRDAFVRQIKQKSGIALEVISSSEESRLGRVAVMAALGPESPPRCIADLGGGSLEISIIRDHAVEQSAQLPVGTVRLMTTLNIPGVIRPMQAEQVRRYVRALLESRLPSRPNLGDQVAVALGGNAETLANIAPGPRLHGLPTLELSFLRERLPDLLERDVRQRMKSYGIRRDRADVLAIAALTFVTLGRYLNIRNFSIPSVGLREGLLQEIARRSFFPDGAAPLQRGCASIVGRNSQLRATLAKRSDARRARSRAEHSPLRPASAGAPSARAISRSLGSWRADARHRPHDQPSRPSQAR